MSHFWPEGIAVTVEADATLAPITIQWQQQRHAVASIARRWRRDVGWWHKRVWREYFIVRTERGVLLELYRDVTTAAWRVQRVYD